MTDTDTDTTRGLQWLMSTPWAILPRYLETMSDIAARSPVRLPDVSSDWQALQTQRRERLGGTLSVDVRDGVAVLPIAGPLFRRANLFAEMSGATSIEMIARDFQAALDDPAVRAIVLAVDSPGGQVNGIAELADHIRRGAQTKPVVSYVAFEGASAAYWLASAAPQVVASSTAVLGSIGAVMSVRRGEDDGRIEIVSTQSPRKRVDIDSEEGRDQMQTLVDDLAAVFIADVARHRGVTEDAVIARFGGGGLLVGERAVRAGLADKLSSLEDVIAGLAGTKQEMLIMSGDTTRPEITADMIRTEHPLVAAELRADVVADLDSERARQSEIRLEAAAAERERIQGCLAQALPGHEALVQSMAFDGASTPEAVAMAIVAAERQAGAEYTAQRRAAAPAPVPSAASQTGGTPSVPAQANPDDEESMRRVWQASKELQSEFGSFEAYLAFEKARSAGRVKILSHAAARAR